MSTEDRGQILFHQVLDEMSQGKVKPRLNGGEPFNVDPLTMEIKFLVEPNGLGSVALHEVGSLPKWVITQGE